MKSLLWILLLGCSILAQPASRSLVSRVWSPDNGDGTYTNPVIHADYSDPDVVRVGRDFYMVSSSFNASPGIPVLHSRDLVNWRLINHVFARQEPLEVFAMPQHGGGVWAPSIRYHGGEFYIYYADPDRGIYVSKAKDPAGTWSKPTLVREAKGWIDPCPFWDADGNAYLVHAFAGSRAGVKSILVVNRMSRDGMSLLDDGVVVFDGHDADPTVEGPKLHKFNGYYYIMAPAGGVATGWQLALRSRSIYGPYERKVVLAQGSATINGPHQGALVDTPLGEWWFLHFQDKGAYGRIVHLQPAKWRNGFPVIGSDPDGDGTGEPVSRHKKPKVGPGSVLQTPPDTDEFDSSEVGKQWQWQGNPDARWAFPFPSKGTLRMSSVLKDAAWRTLWQLPNLLLQKFPAEEFTATAKVTLNSRIEGERFGLVVMGTDYSGVAVTRRGNELLLTNFTAMKADQGTRENETPGKRVRNEFYLRVSVAKGAVCSFSYSTDGIRFEPVGGPFTAKPGKWIGAKVGFFFTRSTVTNDAGSADIDWFRFTRN